MLDSFNQLRLKLLYKSIWDHSDPNIKLFLNKYKLKNFDDEEIIENLFLMEFITNNKAIVNYHKKNYKSIDLQCSCYLRSSDIFYFLTILKIFYMPMMKRRSNKIKLSYDNLSIISFLANQMKDLPLMSDIYYKQVDNIKISICFPYVKSVKKYKKSIIFLLYHYYV